METLRVTALPTGSYELRIDGKGVGVFSVDQLAAGVNLALLETPMLEQARRVGMDTQIKSTLDAQIFGLIVKPEDQITPETVKELAAAEDRALARQRADAQPVPHRYELLPSVTPTATKPSK
jgi:hypothetical protein